MKARLLVTLSKLPRPVQWVALMAMAFVGVKLTGNAESFLTSGLMTLP
jgi:hypothetical protein